MRFRAPASPPSVRQHQTLDHWIAMHVTQLLAIRNSKNERERSYQKIYFVQVHDARFCTAPHPKYQYQASTTQGAGHPPDIKRCES
jgi:hypothetical protein